MSQQWDDKNEQLLIEFLSDKPYLYNRNHENYRTFKIIKECDEFGKLLNPPKTSKQVLDKITNIRKNVILSVQMLRNENELNFDFEKLREIDGIFKKYKYILENLFNESLVVLMEKLNNLFEKQEKSNENNNSKKPRIQIEEVSLEEIQENDYVLIYDDDSQSSHVSSIEKIDGSKVCGSYENTSRINHNSSSFKMNTNNSIDNNSKKISKISGDVQPELLSSDNFNLYDPYKILYLECSDEIATIDEIVTLKVINFLKSKMEKENFDFQKITFDANELQSFGATFKTPISGKRVFCIIKDIIRKYGSSINLPENKKWCWYNQCKFLSSVKYCDNIPEIEFRLPSVNVTEIEFTKTENPSLLIDIVTFIENNSLFYDENNPDFYNMNKKTQLKKNFILRLKKKFTEEEVSKVFNRVQYRIVRDLELSSIKPKSLFSHGEANKTIKNQQDKKTKSSCDPTKINNDSTDYNPDFSDLSSDDGLTELTIPEIEHRIYKRLENGQYQCKDCVLSFDSKLALLAHETSHGEKSLLCYKCGKINRYYKKLRLHENNCNPEDNIYCHECKLTFRNSLNYHDHINQFHTKQNPYICVCRQGFRGYNKIITHLNRSACGSIEDCILPDYVTKDFVKGFLEQHFDDEEEFVQKMVKLKFWCKICKRNFIRNDVYMKHFTREFHLNEEEQWRAENNIDNIFFCDFCNKGDEPRSFDTLYDLIKHRHSQHHKCTLRSFFVEFEKINKKAPVRVLPPELSLITLNCHICKTGYSLEDYAEHFQSKIHKTAEEKWVKRNNLYIFNCSLCSASYENFLEFVSHRNVYHSEWPTNKFLKELEGIDVERNSIYCKYICEVCAFKSNNNRMFAQHMANHSYIYSRRGKW